MRIDVAPIIETIHAQPTLPAHAWLESIVDVTRPALDRGLGIIAFLYDAADPAQIRIEALTQRDTPELGVLEHLESKFDRQYVSESFRKRTCSTASQIPHWDKLRELRSELTRCGIRDALTINGRNDDDGSGAIITAFRPREGGVGERTVKIWSRIAQNLAVAKRVRTLLDHTRPLPAAIFTPDARVLQAHGDARSKSACEQIAHAVKELEQLRASGEADLDLLFRIWKPRVAGRWIIFHQFDADGRRYYVAYEDITTPRFSEREQQVLEKAASGLSNKEIAFDLQLKDSTVRVLIARAMARARVRSRALLIERFVQHWSKRTKL